MTSGAVAIPTQPVSPFSVFRNRNFTWMWTGQLISTMGSALTSLAASIYIFRLTGSAASVGLMLIATAAPSLLFGLIAGVFVDRYDRRKIMLAADLIRAVLAFSIPFLVPYGVGWLYAIVILTSVVGQFFNPAHESTLPDLAGENELAAANSLMAISSFGSTAIGFALSGLIASAADISWAFYLDALSFLISAACILMLRLPPLQAAAEKTSVRAVTDNLKAGMQFLYASPVLRSLLFSGILISLAIGLHNTLLLPFVMNALKGSELQYGIQEGLSSLGFIFGSLLLAGLFDRLRVGIWLVAAIFAAGLLDILYAASGSIAMAIAVMAVAGLAYSPYPIGRKIVIQRHTPRELRGRVISSFYVTQDVFFLVGMAAAGLADLFDVRWLYVLTGGLLILVGLWMFFLPGLREGAAEWRQALHLLRTAPALPGLGAGRAAAPADLDLLAGLLPSVHSLSQRERQELLRHARVIDAPAGTAILRAGESGDAAYFILSGSAVAGIGGLDGAHHSLSTMSAGDFFGEIAALTGSRRTADVVTTQDAALLQVPAADLRQAMSSPAFNQVILATMGTRLQRTSLSELPRFAGQDELARRELRQEVLQSSGQEAG